MYAFDVPVLLKLAQSGQSGADVPIMFPPMVCLLPSDYLA